MGHHNIIQTKSYRFGLEIIKVYRILKRSGAEKVLLRQLLRSGTSIGANVEEAIGGQSKKDFIAKMSIGYKEARETRYWLRLLKDSGIMSPNQSKVLLEDCDELLKIMSSIISTSKESLQS